jgi:hypothetical protein
VSGRNGQRVSDAEDERRGARDLGHREEDENAAEDGLESQVAALGIPRTISMSITASSAMMRYAFLLHRRTKRRRAVATTRRMKNWGSQTDLREDRKDRKNTSPATP